MDLPRDLIDLLAAFVDAKVDLVIVGGHAVAFHAVPRAITTSFAGVNVKIIALADLIANKKASGRPQDLLDVATLERTRKR